MMRQERDTLGTRDVPYEAYYGIQTVRAMENFPVSGLRAPPSLINAYAVIKKAAALTNMELGVLDLQRGSAIVTAAEEVVAGKFAEQFPVDVYQAGAGTSFNMNVNEVIANRALEILGKSRGDYEFLNPNDHVNRSQSSNDTFPTASHIAIVREAEHLDAVLTALATALKKKGDAYALLPKTGRTHLMDAIPVTLGDEFSAYSAAVARAAARVRERRNGLLEVAIGGSATGNGVNTPDGYRDTVIRTLRSLTALDLIPAKNSFEALQSLSQMGAFSGSLKELSLELIRIANDLRLMNSGPVSGLSEISLPPVQPGSSIMPGKFNPVMPECADMIAFRIVGNDTTVSMAVQAGQFEMNVMAPLIVHTILESVSLLTRFLPVFTLQCIDGIVAHEERLMADAGTNPALATLLTPKIGYLRAAELAHESLVQQRPVRDLAIEKGILSEDDADRLFDLNRIARNRYR